MGVDPDHNARRGMGLLLGRVDRMGVEPMTVGVLSPASDHSPAPFSTAL